MRPNRRQLVGLTDRLFRKTESEGGGYIHTLVNWSLSSVGTVHATVLVLGRPTHQNRVVGMSLDMLLEILRALEALAAEIALVRLQGNVNTDMRSDVIALHRGGAARVPLAREVQVVGALATNMLLANVFLIYGMSEYRQGDFFGRGI